MPLTKAQIAVLKNPQVRQRLSGKTADFVYADTLLREVGETCTRLPMVWDRVFYGLTSEQAAWLKATFPGIVFAVPKETAPLTAQPKTLVGRAIETLQSYKKAP